VTVQQDLIFEFQLEAIGRTRERVSSNRINILVAATDPPQGITFVDIHKHNSRLFAHAVSARERQSCFWHTSAAKMIENQGHHRRWGRGLAAIHHLASQARDAATGSTTGRAVTRTGPAFYGLVRWDEDLRCYSGPDRCPMMTGAPRKITPASRGPNTPDSRDETEGLRGIAPGSSILGAAD
jgi:hypothetical protein